MSGRIGTLLLPLLALGSAGYASWHVFRANQPLPKAVPPIPPVVAPFSRTLAAAGIVEPISENVVVGTHVSGVVERVHVSAGDRVAAGAPLFRVDTRVLQVVYAFEEDSPGLFVGQQVDVFVDLAGPEAGDAGPEVRPVKPADSM